MFAIQCNWNIANEKKNQNNPVLPKIITKTAILQFKWSKFCSNAMPFQILMIFLFYFFYNSVG